MLQKIFQAHGIACPRRDGAISTLEVLIERYLHLNDIARVLEQKGIQVSPMNVDIFISNAVSQWVKLQAAEGKIEELQKQLKEMHEVARVLNNKCWALQSNVAKQRTKEQEYVKMLGILDLQRQVLIAGGEDAQELIDTFSSVDPHLPEGIITASLTIAAETEGIPDVPNLPDLGEEPIVEDIRRSLGSRDTRNSSGV